MPGFNQETIGGVCLRLVNKVIANKVVIAVCSDFDRLITERIYVTKFVLEQYTELALIELKKSCFNLYKVEINCGYCN